jgi:ubiquinone/menaquinone biosynthesis C-methylase UbiE
MAGAANRHVAAVKALGPIRSRRLLDIGCGHGVATRLLCEGATDGHVVALDRSAKMIAATAKSCDDHLRSGRLTLIEGDFEDQAFDAAFDGIIGVNVDFPRHKDKGWAEALARALCTGGEAVLVLEAPALQAADMFAMKVSEALGLRGFEVHSTISRTTRFLAVVDARLTRT